MKLICYQDEKMYDPPPEGMSMEELKDKIRKLELEIYGHEIEDDGEPIAAPELFYDTVEKKHVRYEDFIETDRGKKFLEENEEIYKEEGFI